MRHIMMRLGCIGQTATIYANRQLRPVFKYGHLHTVQRVVLFQALYYGLSGSFLLTCGGRNVAVVASKVSSNVTQLRYNLKKLDE